APAPPPRGVAVPPHIPGGGAIEPVLLLSKSWPQLATKNPPWQAATQGRPARYPGAIYHVMNRGDRREALFEDDRDRQRLLETLGEACGKTGWQVQAYCLMVFLRQKDGCDRTVRLGEDVKPSYWNR